MILIKSNREIELMRQAGKILANTRDMLEKHIKPGISTYQLDQLAHEYIISQNATPSFKDYNGFQGSICTSVNEVVVHGIPSSNKILKDGDIISIDIGVDYKGYHSDSGWTYPVGKISPEIKQLLKVTEEALFVGLSTCKPGAHVGDVGSAIEKFIKPYKYGIVEEFTGHGIGKNLHEDPDVPNFGKKGTGALLKPGMTFCVEPMINLGTKKVKILEDNWTTVTLDRKPSAHFEHTILITEDGYEILSTNNKEIKNG